MAIDANCRRRHVPDRQPGRQPGDPRQTADPATGKLNILNAAATGVDCRIQTGNLPSGVAMRAGWDARLRQQRGQFFGDVHEHRRWYLSHTTTRYRLRRAPNPGSFEHAVLVGKLAFFTALGIPDNDIFGTPIRDFVPRNFKGKHVERRLEQLRVVPSGRAGRWRNLDFRHRAAPDESAGRDVLQAEPG